MNAINDYDMETHYLVCDFIRYYLLQQHLSWDECPELPAPNWLRVIMRTWGCEFVRDYGRDFVDLVDGFYNIEQPTYGNFWKLARGIFDDDINWGRVVGLFAFSAKLAEYCHRHNKRQLIGQVAEWLTMSLKADEPRVWLEQKGGWSSLVEFYDCIQE